MNADGTRTMTTHMYKNLDFVFIYIILTFLLLTRINLDLTVLLRCITTGFFPAVKVGYDVNVMFSSSRCQTDV